MTSTVLRLAKSSAAVEEGFLAAGITIVGVAIVQSAVILLSWFV